MKKTNDEIVDLSNDRYGVIYKITNNANGKVYIGQTNRSFKRRYCYCGNGIERVYAFHNSRKINGFNYNKHLLSAIKKYGFDSFEVIEEYYVAKTLEELNGKEKEFIEKYDSYHNGYNQTLGGEGSLGFKKDKKEFDIDGLFLNTEKQIVIDNNMSSNDVRVFLLLSTLYNNGLEDMTIEEMSSKISVSRATFIRSIRKLVDNNYINIHKKKGVLGNNNVYEVIV